MVSSSKLQTLCKEVIIFNTLSIVFAIAEYCCIEKISDLSKAFLGEIPPHVVQFVLKLSVLPYYVLIYICLSSCLFVVFNLSVPEYILTF